MTTTITRSRGSITSSSDDSSTTSSTSKKVSSASSTDNSADNDIQNDSESSLDHYADHDSYETAAHGDIPPSPIASLCCSLVIGVSCTVAGVALAVVHGLRLNDPASHTVNSDAAFVTVGGMLAFGGVGCVAAGVGNYFYKSQIPACVNSAPV